MKSKNSTPTLSVVLLPLQYPDYFAFSIWDVTPSSVLEASQPNLPGKCDWAPSNAEQCSWTSPAAAGSDRCGDLENVAMWAMNLMELIDVAVWAIFRLAMCGGCDNVGDVLVVVDGQIG